VAETLLWLLAGLAVFVISGQVLLKFVYGNDVFDLGAGPEVGVSFLLGLGAVSLQMFAYSLASVPFDFPKIAGPWLLIFFAFIFSPSGKRASPAAVKKPHGPGLRALSAVALLIIATQTVYAFLYSPLLPVTGWDAWSNWFLKARVFFIDRAVTEGFLLDGNYSYSHPGYPLLVPLSVAWVYTSLGFVDDALAKVIYPAQYVSMLLVFHHVIKRVFDGRNALLFTSLLSITPIVMAHAAGFPVAIKPLHTGDFTGYADLTLAVYFLGAGAFFYLYLNESRPVHLVVSAMFLAMGAWTRPDGMVFAAAGAVLILIGAARRAGPLTLLKVFILIGAFVAPWEYFKLKSGLSGEYIPLLTTQNFWGNLGRLDTIVLYMLSYMFAGVGLFNFTWWGLTVSSIINWRGIASREIVVLYALICIQLIAYALMYVLAPGDFTRNMEETLPGRLVHLVPLVMMLAAVNLNTFLYKRDIKEAEAQKAEGAEGGG